MILLIRSLQEFRRDGSKIFSWRGRITGARRIERHDPKDPPAEPKS